MPPGTRNALFFEVMTTVPEPASANPTGRGRGLFSGLRGRVALVVMLAISPLFGLAVYSGVQQRQEAAARVHEEALRLAQLAAAQQAEAVRDTRQLLAGLAALPEVRAGDLAACAKILQRMRLQNERYLNLGIAAPDGRLVCSAVPPKGPVNIADRPYFKRALARYDFASGDYQVGRVTGQISLNFAYPVVDETGQVRAVVFAALDLDWLSRLATNAGLPAGAVVSVVDLHGTILARYPNPSKWISRSDPDAARLRAIREQGGHGWAQGVGADGRERLFAFTPLTGEGGLRNVFVCVEIPAKAAYAGADWVFWRNLAWLGIVVLLALLDTSVVANKFILRPVRAMAAAATRLTQGDLAARAGAQRSPGELGELQEVFDEMAASVQQSTLRLREAETKYRTLVERLPAITYVAAPGAGGRWQYISPQVETILGFTPAEWLADPGLWLRQIHPEDRDRVIAEETRCLQANEPFSCEYRLLPRQGEPVWVRDQAVALRDEHGRVNALSGIIHDINQLKCMEEVLRESEERFRCLSSSSPMGILLTDVDGGCVYANPRLRDTLGLSLAQALGEGWQLAIHPEDRRGVRRRWAVCARRGREFSREFRVGPRQGTTRWVHIRTSVMVTDRGERIGHVGTVEDITKRKAAEDALRETNRQLEQMVTELRQTQQQVVQQERLRALGQLASGVAHDFNNALAKIIGFTDLLMSSPSKLTDPVKLTGYLDRINIAAHDATNVVKRLREFYRKRDDTEVFQPLDLNVVVQQAVGLTEPKWRQQAQANGVTVTMHTEGGALPPVAGNEADLREALTNLIFNAVDAIVSTQRDGAITLRTGMEAGRVMLRISDTGGGMTEEVRRHCFEPFYSTKGERGTGLGLATVYGIVQRHGGQIHVESAWGQGTTFVLSLPPGAESQPVAAPTVVETRMQSLRVLVAEDELILRDIETEYLTGDGHWVETAANGSEALEKFLAGKFDLVVTDQAMPEMNGEQLTTAIKRAAPQMPVIMVTGFGDMLEEGAGAPSGPDLIVGKPVTQAALRQAIRKVAGPRANAVAPALLTHSATKS